MNKPMKNLILIYPKHGEGSEMFTGDISLALLYLAGSARNVCDNIKIFDFNSPLPKGKTVESLEVFIQNNTSENGITVIGINCLFTSLFPDVRKLASRIKSLFPHVKIVTGGMHPTLYAQEIIKNCCEFDAVGIGESDESFPKLLRFFYGEISEDQLDSCVIRINDEIRHYPKISYINDLDNLPMPGYEYFDFSEYAVDTEKWYSPDGFKISSVQMPILTSRSCPNKCNFCSMRLVMGDKIRFRSAESIFEEIQYLYNVYGINYFKIQDDNFTMNRDRAKKICRLIIESSLNVYFDAAGGLFIKSLDEELVYLMRKAGFIMVGLAVESGSDYIRKTIMGKKLERDEIINAFKHCKSNGIIATALIMVGMPEDTEETLTDTMNIIKEIEASRVAVTIVKPICGTRLYEQCIRENLLVYENTHELWDGTEETKLATDNWNGQYILNGRQYNPNFFIKPYNLTFEKLTELYLKILELRDEKSKKWREFVLSQHESD